MWLDVRSFSLHWGGKYIILLLEFAGSAFSYLKGNQKGASQSMVSPPWTQKCNAISPGRKEFWKRVGVFCSMCWTEFPLDKELLNSVAFALDPRRSQAYVGYCKKNDDNPYRPSLSLQLGHWCGGENYYRNDYQYWGLKSCSNLIISFFRSMLLLTIDKKIDR